MTTFNEERARTYDAGARTIMPGYEALHEMARDAFSAFLKPQSSARLLLVGVGTGYEAQELRRRFPSWELIGVDPSEPMLAIARQRLADQVELRHGVIDDFADLQGLDAILSVGVLHHLPTPEERPHWIRSLAGRLRSGGALVIATHVGPFNVHSPRFRILQARWRHQGATQQEIAARTDALLTLIHPPSWPELQRWYQEAGLSQPEPIFQVGYFQLVTAEKLP